MKFFASAFSGTRARWFRHSVAPIFLMSILVLALTGAGCSDDGEDITYSTPPAPEQMNWLFDVFGTGPDDVYACGNKGAMFHFDGSEWSFVDMGSSVPITSIWGPGDGTLYAVGHSGKLWQNTGGSWSAQSSGTSKNLYGVGLFNNDVHICGEDGALRRLNGNSWSDVGPVMVVRSPAIPHAPEDTLLLHEDIASLLTVNQYFIGGAYKLPDFEGEYIGLNGIDGMVLSLDMEPESFDWELRPLGDDEFALSEWMMCTTTSVPTLGDNYLGTSEGWVFQLALSDEGNNVWSKMSPDLTSDARSGVRDMWLDEDSNLYMVTDDGDLVFQSSDYNFSEGLGMRQSFPITHSGLTSIWGSDTDNIYMTGFTENTVIKGSMEIDDTSVNFTFTEIILEFPNKGGQSIGMFEDQFGMPRR